MEERNFRRIDNNEIAGMIHLDGKQISMIDSENYYTFTAVSGEKISEALVIRADRSFV